MVSKHVVELSFRYNPESFKSQYYSDLTEYSRKHFVNTVRSEINAEIETLESSIQQAGEMDITFNHLIEELKSQIAFIDEYESAFIKTGENQSCSKHYYQLSSKRHSVIKV